MRVANMRVVKFLEIYAFFPTFLETKQIIGFYDMRVVSKICVLGYAFFKRINRKTHIFGNNAYFLAKRIKKNLYTGSVKF